MKKNRVFVLLAFLLTIQQAQLSAQPVELGSVAWLRNYHEAVKQSKEVNKPILILFQEVPGCATCRNYGQDVLSHPLLVDAIEQEFVPLAIFNNKGGHDGEILQRFKEPAWNNPVVRIVTTQGKDITQRISGNYSSIGLVKGMIHAMKAVQVPVPPYLTLLKEELEAHELQQTNEAYFSMYCFWTGEKQLGSVHGVVDTETGFINGKEVVKVSYDKNKTNAATLNQFAKTKQWQPMKDGNHFHSSHTDHYYTLKHTNYQYLPLTPLQKTKINSLVGSGKSARHLLSPTQLKWLDMATNNTDTSSPLYLVDFFEAWKKKEAEL